MTGKMKASVRRRLENKGWVVGNVREFLGLTAEEEAYIELRLKLAEGLKTRRKRRGLSQTALAESLKSSQSRVAKMEAADASVSLDLMIRALLALEAKPSEIAGAIERARR